MKKLLSILTCICLLAPAAYAFAVGQDDTAGVTLPPDDGIAVQEFITNKADAQIAAGSTMMRAAYMERMMSCLAMQAYLNGEGWISASDIPDMWAGVYSYINKFDLGTHPDWEHTEQGFVRVPAEYVKQLFCDMYGVNFDQLPQVSRTYSSAVIYDAQSDVYDITGADGEMPMAVLSMVSLDGAGGASMMYEIVQEFMEDGRTVTTTLATATIQLSPTSDTAYGLSPVRLDLELESVG